MTVAKRILLTTLLLGSVGFWAGGVFADSFIINGEKLLDGRVNTRGATDGDVMKYDGTTMQWAAAEDDTGAGGVATNDTASAVLIGTGSGWAQETDATIDSNGNITGVTGTFSGSVFGAGNGFQITSGTELMRSSANVATDTQWRIRHRTDSLDGRLAIQLYDATAGFEHQYQFLPSGEFITPGAVTANGTLTLKADNYIYDNKHLAFGTDQDFRLEYISASGLLSLHDGTNTLVTVADQNAAGGLLTLGDVTTSDDVTVGDDLVVTGLATVGETLDVAGLASLDGGLDIDGTLTVDGTTGVLTTSALANLDGGFKIDTDKLVVSDAGVITSSAGITALGLVLGTTGNFEITAAGIMTADALANLDGGIKVDTNKFVVSTAGDVTVAGDLTVGDVLKQPIGTFTASDATPDVSGGNIFNANSTAAVTITNLDNAVIGQTITIIGTHSSNTATFTDGATFYLSATHALGSQDTLVLLCDSVSPNRFIELSYSNN